MSRVPAHPILLRRSPQKWLKYEVLNSFGITPIEYENSVIRRFRWDQSSELVLEIERLLPQLGALQFCVVKFIPYQLRFLLPNYRIYNHHNLQQLRRGIETAGSGYEEIWYCLTQIDPAVFSVAGRIVIDKRGGCDTQTIEQVWRCSPRLIESFGDDFHFTFVQAKRPNWEWYPKITHHHVPAGQAASFQQLQEELGKALMMMLPLKERLLHFEDFLFKCGCDCFSLEYKVEGSRLHFMDWDTHQDMNVLAVWQSTVRGDD